MPTPAEDFAAAIETVKTSVAGIIQPLVPKTKVATNFLFDDNGDQWAGLLKSPNDLGPDGKKRVNAIQIYYTGLDEDQQAPISSMDPLLPLGIDFFMLYESGTNDDNSEKRLMKAIAMVKFGLAAKTDLNARQFVMGHNGLRVAPGRLKLRRFGATPIQYALGVLEVRMQSWYVRGL